MGTWNNLQKVSRSMSVFQTLSLIFLALTFLLTLLDYINKH